MEKQRQWRNDDKQSTLQNVNNRIYLAVSLSSFKYGIDNDAGNLFR